MTHARRALPLALAAALAGVACSPSARSDARGAAAAPAKASADAVVARVHGQDITAAELDQRASPKLVTLRQQEYDARREALDELVAQRLFEHEAAARGVKVEALLAEEIERKAAAPDEAQMRLLYEQNRGSMGGRSFEQMRPQIEDYLRQQARAVRRESLRAELAAKAGIQVLLRPPRYEVSVPPTAPSEGPATARVTVVSFADYQCPYCQRAEQTVAELLRRYPNKLRLVHRDFPLDFHPRARMAARASYCAGEQGRFWEYHRALLLQPGDYADAELLARARALGLQEGPFGACLGSERFDAVIAAGIEDGRKLGVNSTPTFFINGRMVSGARPVEYFAEVIDEELAAGG